MSRTFRPPRCIFPKKGPYTRDALAATPTEALREIPVTKENVHQLAFFNDRLSPERVREAVGARAPSVEDLQSEAFVENYFRNWPTRDLDKIRLLAENFVLHIDRSDNACVYFPAIYWVQNGSAVRSGPFSVRPASSTFHVVDLYSRKQVGSATWSSACTRWQTMEHPHVNANSACLGTEEAAYFNLYRAHDLYGLAYLFENLIEKYNPESPFRRFRLNFPGEIQSERVEPNLFLYSENACVYMDEARQPTPLDSELVDYQVGGFKLHLSIQEHQAVLRCRPRHVISFFTDYFRNNIPNLMQDESNRDVPEEDRPNPITPEQTERFLDRILPYGDSWSDRIQQAGISFTPGFNQSDQPITATTIPFTKEHALEYPKQNTDETGQADGTDPSTTQAQADSGPENVEQADPVETGDELISQQSDPVF